MELEGGCHCGEIRWKATVDEGRIGICHCRDCQIFSGSAFRTIGVARLSDFAFVSGKPRTYTKETFRGTKRQTAFCATCGTHLCSLPDTKADLQFVSLRLSSCDGFAAMKPSAETFCRSRVDWIQPVEGAAQYDTMPLPD